jgi:uncharacterized protein (UPF0276 family)
MNFAINYSPQAAELVRKGRIEVDFFKTPPWSEMIAEAETLRPIAVHFDFWAGDLGSPDWEAVKDFLARTETAYINLHLGVKPTEMPHLPVNEPPNTEQREEIIDFMLANVHILTARFGAERVIAENIPFRLKENSNVWACVEPAVISAVIERAGCGLLLDISHARIAAQSLGIEPHAYIEALPVKNLRELHFTGLHNWGGYAMDHLEILEADWPWLDWVLEKVNSGTWGSAHMLAFEYGGTGDFFRRFSDPEVMAAQVPRLYKLCHNRTALAWKRGIES